MAQSQLDVIGNKNLSSVDLLGAYAGCLALTEVGLGSLLHAFHVPFSGSFLSLNQIFILTLSSLNKPTTRFTPALISFITAMLKSLAPVGKKVTPMLAISMQGLLFNCGILLFGNSIFGMIVGAILASLWGFAQSLLLYYLIFGRTLFDAVSGVVQYVSWDENTIYYGLACLACTKVVLAIAIVCVTPRLPLTWINFYLDKLSRLNSQQNGPKPKALQGALRDICMPMFLLAMGVSAFFYFSIEQDYTVLFWHLLRPLTVGFVCFFILRWLPIEQITFWFESKRANNFSKALRIALQKIRNI